MPESRGGSCPRPPPPSRRSVTGEQPVAGTSPFAGVGTWLSRYRITREFGGAAPSVTPAAVDAMADAGVRTIYLQPAADDPRYPGLLSRDILGEFLVRAHARDLQVVAWYLPRFGDIAGDLRRLQEIGAFRVDGQGFDAIAVDIEFTDAVELAPRNAALIELSRQLRAALPDVELGAIVLPPVVTDVLNTAYWPDFPWRELRDLYDVWLPMAYWSNRSEEGFTDPHWYVSENIAAGARAPRRPLRGRLRDRRLRPPGDRGGLHGDGAGRHRAAGHRRLHLGLADDAVDGVAVRAGLRRRRLLTVELWERLSADQPRLPVDLEHGRRPDGGAAPGGRERHPPADVPGVADEGDHVAAR